MNGIAWLKRFEVEKRRPLRVLHIGNIANNAYNNAKIQRRYGIEADVLCHDYYHIMSCPEWEDADFEGDPGDPNFPDWWAVELRGFKRPKWFAQGHLDPCLRSLISLRLGLRVRAAVHQRLCDFDRWTLCGRSDRANRVRGWIKRETGRDVAYLAAPALPLVARYLGTKLDDLSTHSLVSRLPIGALIRRVRKALFSYAQTGNFLDDRTTHMAALASRVDEILRRAQEILSPVGRSLAREDLDWFFEWWWHPRLASLFEAYDVVQAYGICTAMPLLVGERHYVAYEHGTIRAIPFQDDMHGRMCAMSYRAAAAVFVTNSDNLVAAERLGIAGDRLVCLPHAFDTEKLERFADAHRIFRPAPDGPCLFFAPARQDWRDGNPSWAKGNDRFLRAAAKLYGEGADLRLVLVEWGRDLAASRALVVELGLEDCVRWTQTMRKRELWQHYLRSHCVVDQFMVPAIGGVTFEAMTLGRRVITAMDAGQTARFFGETPPIHAAATEDEIADAMRAIIADRDDGAGRGARNRQWIARRHSAERIVGLQVAAYRRVIESNQAHAKIG